MKLTAAYATKRLKEADSTDGLSHSDIRCRLSDALNDTLMGGQYGYIQDIFGDDKSGEVVYCCGGDMFKAPYEIGDVNGFQVASIDTDAAVDVVPRTIYEEESDEADHYAAMEEAFKTQTIYTGLPLYERFIAKSERDAADSSDFAGKGKSFPILKPGDVMAAVRSMGRAGASNSSPTNLKSRIIAIAKRKGWTKYLPKAWQGGVEDSKEAATITVGEIKLVEGAGAFLEDIPLRESRVDYPIKIISAGTGSTAHYPAKVLERDGPKIFGPGTLMFWNHPTAAEEAARPEGNLDNLAAITTTRAEWKENGPKGPGLYATAKVMADYAQKVEERAPHIGLSIRAGGTGTGKLVEGKPELKSLDYAESVDYVTKAGRGGMALAEAAKNAGIALQESEKEADMTAEEITRLIEASNAPLRAQLLRESAERKAVILLEGVSLPTKAKLRIIESVISRGVPVKDGGLDETAFREAIAAEAKSIGEILAEATGSGRVFGLGSAPVINIDPKEAKRERKLLKEERKRDIDILEELTGNKEVAALAAKGREDAA
jgi:hypothetical protein